MHNIPSCCFCHNESAEQSAQQGHTAAGQPVKHTNDDANDQNRDEDDQRVVEKLLATRPDDLLQLTAHFAEPFGEASAGTDEEIGLLVNFCHCFSSFRLLRFGMNGMLSAEPAILLHFQTVGIILLVLHGVVVSLLALVAAKGDLYSHCSAPP